MLHVRNNSSNNTTMTCAQANKHYQNVVSLSVTVSVSVNVALAPANEVQLTVFEMLQNANKLLL